MIRKVFPYNAESSFFNSFKIIFVSEGYLASESALFKASCINFVDRLVNTSPFNLTRINNNWLSVYSSFVASNNQGAGIDSSPVTDRTAFEIVADTSTELLSINQEKLNNYLDSETFRHAESILNLNDYVGKGGLNRGAQGALIVLLLPPLSGHPSGAEFENTPGEEDYHFVAVTQDGEWHQVVIRAVCKFLGLSDEFEQPGDEFHSPTDEEQQTIMHYPNLQFSDDPPSTVNSELKWYNLFPAVQRGEPVSVHSKTGDTAEVDNTINSDLTTFPHIEFWEGGGGFRTKVYRSAQDCLLRRQIGNKNLSLRKAKVGFCPVCSTFLKNKVL